MAKIVLRRPGAASGSASFGRVFYEDFESSSWASNWDDNPPWNMPTRVASGADGTTPKTGSWMIRANWNGTTAWNDPVTQEQILKWAGSWPYTSEIMIRFWLRYDANVDDVDGGKVFRWGEYPTHSFILGRVPGKLAWAHFELINGANGPQTFNAGSFAEGTWHEIVLYAYSHSSAGIVRMYFDGSLELEATGKNTAAAGWDEMSYNSNWSNNLGWEHDATNYTYMDEFEVYTDQGTGGYGSMADGTARTTP